VPNELLFVCFRRHHLPSGAVQQCIGRHYLGGLWSNASKGLARTCLAAHSAVEACADLVLGQTAREVRAQSTNGSRMSNSGLRPITCRYWSRGSRSR